MYAAKQNETDFIAHTLSLFQNITFSIVSRRNLDYALEELKLQLSGYMDDESIINLGAFVGATHIVILSEQLFITKNPQYWNTKKINIWEIIELETMTVKSLDTATEFFIQLSQNKSYRSKKILNYKEVVFGKDGKQYYK